jgi:arylsulfatase A-like enzyme
MFRSSVVARVSFALLLLSSAPLRGQAPPTEARPPNVVLILSDDAGYADFSFQGTRRFPTPHIDTLAARGVQFTQAYVSASVCSPSRAGLITGRYQQRFGHEHNFPSNSGPEVGLAVGERTLADALGDHGYRTIGLGKWHLGYGPDMHPLERGFDHYHGFLQGSRSYWPDETDAKRQHQEDGETLDEDFAYVTDHLGERAAGYVADHAHEPFFLYLSFTAVHTPMHALEPDLAAVEDVQVEKRRKLAAMTVAMDRAVGQVLAALREHDLERDTLLVFVNDNGGAWNNGSSNGALRGTKGTPYEGGVRVPMLAQWPGVLPAGTVYDLPVSTLDLFATALAAAGPAAATDPSSSADRGHLELDGVDLVPFLTGRARGRPHEALFWRRRTNQAVRVGDWKLVIDQGMRPVLFDLAEDPGESRDLAAEHPDVVRELADRFERWATELVPPGWGSSAVNPPAAR